MALSACQSAKTVEGSTASVDVPTNSTTAEASLEDALSPAPAETTSETKQEAFAEKYNPPKRGTVFTYRNNWASLPKVIAYKVSGIERVGSKKYVKFTSVQGLQNTVHAYYDTESYSLKGYRNAAGAALVTYQPVEKRYQFPLKPGAKWITHWRSKDHKTDTINRGGGIVRVEGIQRLELPSGVHRVVKVRLPLPNNSPRGMTHYLWFSPKLGVTVKEEIRGTNMNWTQILESVKFPS